MVNQVQLDHLGANQCVDNTHQGWDGSSWSTKVELPQLYLDMVTGTSNVTFIVGGTVNN